MKKKLLFLAFSFQLSIFAQIDFSTFPKIGFTDLYFLTLESTYNGGNPISNLTNYLANDYYYPKLRELGLTHLVTMADDIPFNPAYNRTLKILDNNFGWRDRSLNAVKYSRSSGNYTEHLPYQAGGGNISLINNITQRFGFGTNDYSSWWIYSYNQECVGNTNYLDDEPPNNVRVHQAPTGTQGLLLKARIDYTHHPRAYQDLKLFITTRIDGPAGNVNVLKVRVSDEIVSTSNDNGFHSGLYPENNVESQPLLDYTYYIKADQFLGNNYIDIPSPNYFRKRYTQQQKYWNLVVEIFSEGTRDVYIDKIAVCDKYYYDFLIDENTSDDIRGAITNNLTSVFSNRINSNPNLYSHFYRDEPYPTMYRGSGEVNTIAENIFPGKYINGATQMLPNDMMLHANFERRVPYVLHDAYTITDQTTTSSTGPNNLQLVLDELTNKESVEVGYGVKRYSGLKQAILWANNFTPDDLTDDIPMVSTIQVQGEKHFNNGQIDNYQFRPPTPNEILAEGFLSLCYGAKGMMYFCVFTNTPNPTGTGWGFYGLFDSEGIFQLHQNPELVQVPNDRFDAVKILNQEIDKISPELLQLTWVDAFSFYKSDERIRLYTYSYPPNSKSFIKDVICAWPAPDGPIVPDPLDESFVEVGVFKKTNDFVNDNLDYFMVMNRRCLADENRMIKIKIQKENSIFRNWKITDIATGSTWVIDNNNNNNSYFEFNLNPGCGKLFKLEPVMLAGGNIVYNENVPAGTSLDINGTIIVNDGATLTINPTSVLNFHNYKSLIVVGNLVGDGLVLSGITLNFLAGYAEAPSAWGLSFDKGSSGSIKNFTIQGARTGIFVNETSVEINTCMIRDCAYSCIDIYRSNYAQSQPTITNNFIISSNGSQPGHYGISLAYSSPIIRNNVIGNFDKAIYCLNNSSPSLGEMGIAGNNHITGNSIGVYAYSNSNPYLGSWFIGGGNNEIFNNSDYNIYADNRSNILAEYNWWGSNPPNTALFFSGIKSSIDYTPWMTSPPTDAPEDGNNLLIENESSNSNSIEEGEVIQNDSPTMDIMENILLAKRYVNEGKYLRSINICRNIITEFPDTSLSFTALDILWEAGRKLSVPQLRLLLRYIYNTNNQNPLFANAGVLLAGYQNNHFELLDSIISNYSGNPIVESILLNKFLHYYYDLSDTVSARIALNELDDLFPESESAINAHLIMNDDQYNLLSKQNLISNTEILPNEYELYNCYPNPFNPTTTIKYDLPVDGLVALEVFDLLGRKIATLVNENKVAGSYQQLFDATSLASGVYIYKIQSGDFVSSKKMLLIK